MTALKQTKGMNMNKLEKNENETNPKIGALDKYLLTDLKKDCQKLLLEISRVESVATGPMSLELLESLVDAEDTYSRMMKKFFTLWRRLSKKQKR